MVEKAKKEVGKSCASRRLQIVQGVAKCLPFAEDSFDCVVCKGAIDHFLNPTEAVEEMGRVVKQSSRVVVSVANYESLSCKLGRYLAHVWRGMPGDARYWVVPPDHVTKFDYTTLKAVCEGVLGKDFASWDGCAHLLPHLALAGGEASKSDVGFSAEAS